MTTPSATDNGQPSTTTSAQLRDRTADQHTAAEQSPFQRMFVRGQLPQATYIEWLGQMLLMYRRLEQRLEEARKAGARVLDVAPWRHTAELEQDLKHWRRDASPAPVSATGEFLAQLDRWSADEPLALLGPLYVLEGSTNGARYIARGVRKAYGLSGREGTAFLDPYGDDQPRHWAAFKQELDAHIPGDAAAPVVAAAAATFDAISAIGAELLQPSGAP